MARSKTHFSEGNSQMIKLSVLAMALAAAAAAAAAAAVGTEAMAKDQYNPVIAPYGRIAPAPNAAMQPDPKLDYRVAFSISRAAPAPDKPNSSLERVAR